MKKWLIGIGAVFIVFIGIGAYFWFFMWNKAHRDILAEPAAYEMTAEALHTEFKEDEQKANKKYLDEVILVSGNVEKVDGDSALTLILTGVVCNMYEGADNTLQQGEGLKIKGKVTAFDDMFGEVRMDKCFVIKD